MEFEHGIETADFEIHPSWMALLQPCEAMARKIDGNSLFVLKPAKLKGVNCGQIQQNIITSMTNSYLGDPYGIRSREPVTLDNDPIYGVLGRVIDQRAGQQYSPTGKKWDLHFTRLLGSSQKKALHQYILRLDKDTLTDFVDMQEMLKKNWTTEENIPQVIKYFDCEDTWKMIAKEDSTFFRRNYEVIWAVNKKRISNAHGLKDGTSLVRLLRIYSCVTLYFPLPDTQLIVCASMSHADKSIWCLIISSRK